MNKICVLLATSALMLTSGAETILEPGRVEVVIEKTAKKPVVYAATELTNFLSRALGAAVPVRKGAIRGDADRTVEIVLGETAAAKDAGIDVSEKPRDTFVIKTVGNRVFIVGRDGTAEPRRAPGKVECATLHGVYAFLEDYVGCRFYFPGELGEIVPRVAKVTLGDLDRTVTPDFLIRRYYNSERDGRWFEPVEKESKAKAVNWLRLRASTMNIPCCHGMNKIDLVKKYAKTHPEYFALRKDGTRCTNFTGYHSSLKGYPCFSCKGLWDVVVDWCVEQAAKGAKYVDIMPNDALQLCQCDACRAAYAKANDPNCPMSELVWGYTKYVAEKLKEKKVDVIVTQMAYSQYRSIPPSVDIPDNVRVMVAESGPWALSNPAALKKQYDEIRAWKAKSGNPIWIWTYPHKFWSLAVPGLPDVAPKAWGEYYKPLAGDILGTFAESETDRWLYHYLNYYVFTRVMWDAKTDVDAVLDEHYRLMFGAAAKEMQAFYETLEHKWTHDLAGKVKDSAAGPVTVPPTEPEIWEKIYGPDETAKLCRMLDAAAAKVSAGSLEARRIALIRREYFDPIVSALKAYAKKKAGIKSLVYTAGQSQPIELHPFKVKKGREPDEYVKTRVTVAKEADELVVRYDAEDNRMDDLQGSEKPLDDKSIWRDASVEIYLNPSADLTTYYHIVVNLFGSVADSKGIRTGSRSQMVDSSWNSDAKVKVDKRADGWAAEIRIPLASLGEVKDAFPAEFVRNRNTRSGKGQCLYNWSPYVYGFNSIDQFGTVDLSKPLLRFGVVSDIHITADGDGRMTKPDSTNMFRKALGYFDAQRVDAVVIAGDLANNGRVAELLIVGKLWDEVFPSGKGSDGRPVEKVFIYGNHDPNRWPSRNTHGEKLIIDDPAGAWEQAFHEPYRPVYVKTVKGYDFVCAHWGQEGRAVAQIESAGKSGRPFFHVQHPNLLGTVHGGKVGQDFGEVFSALSKFPQTVSFSGHSHLPLENEQAIWQGAFTAINTAALRYIAISSYRSSQFPRGYENGKVKRHSNADADGPKVMYCEHYHTDLHEGLLVNVYSNRIVFSRREFGADVPIGADWIVPLDGSRPYDLKTRRKAAVAPEFPIGAKLTVTRVQAKPIGGKKGEKVDAWELRFPAAKGAYEYEITGTGPDGKPVVSWVFATKKQKVRLAASRFAADKVSFEVVPVDSLGCRGKGLKK